MPTALITGGAGFLGSHLADALCARGDEVIIVDHFQKEKLRFLPKAAQVHRFDFADVRVRDVLMKTRPDVVFHLAAQISVTTSVLFPSEDARKNILASVRFLQWCKDAQVGRFVFASSGGAIYGDHPEYPTPLLRNPQPLSPYGMSKQSVEHYLQYFEAFHGLSSISLRFSNLYGPRQQVTKPTGEGNVLSIFLDKLLVTHEPCVLFGDGSATRDFVYVADAVRALLSAASVRATGSVNVGSGKAVRILDVWQELLRIHGKEHSVVYAPSRTGEVYCSVIDPSSAHTVLAWEAEKTFSDGLQETYAWYKRTFAS